MSAVAATSLSAPIAAVKPAATGGAAALGRLLQSNTGKAYAFTTLLFLFETFMVLCYAFGTTYGRA